MLSRKNISPFILFIIILLLWQCKGNEEEDIRLITFQGSNVGRFLDYNTSFSALDSLGYGSLLTRKGELLATDKFVISVSRDLADTLSIHQLDSLLFINGNLTGISIAKNSPPLSFFNQLSEEEISHLKTIHKLKVYLQLYSFWVLQLEQTDWQDSILFQFQKMDFLPLILVKLQYQ